MRRFIFLHLQITPVPWIKLNKEKEEQFPETLKEIGHAEYELNKLVKKAEYKGLKAEEFLVFNVGREEILKHIPFHHHDFVVMGSHGASGAKELFVGSNAQKVLRDATVPVLIIKEKSKWHQGPDAQSVDPELDVVVMAVKERFLDMGRPWGDMYEVALWQDMLKVEADELYYAYVVDNQAIVIPETMDAIRELT